MSRNVREPREALDDLAVHLSEIECRQRAAKGSTDPEAVAWLSFWMTQHRNAITVSLASAVLA